MGVTTGMAVYTPAPAQQTSGLCSERALAAAKSGCEGGVTLGTRLPTLACFLLADVTGQQAAEISLTVGIENGCDAPFREQRMQRSRFPILIITRFLLFAPQSYQRSTKTSPQLVVSCVTPPVPRTGGNRCKGVGRSLPWRQITDVCQGSFGFCSTTKKLLI